MIYAKLQKDKNYYHIVKGDEIDGYKFVFDWIKQCAAQQDVVNIDDVSCPSICIFNELTSARRSAC